MRLRGRFVLSLTLILFGILIAACGSDSGEPLLKAANADEQLHMALLSPDDIPGSWVVAEDDDFLEAEDLAPDSSCDALRPIRATHAEASMARAQRRLEGDPVAAVEVELVAFETAETATDLLAQERSLSGGTIAACWTETLKRQRLDSTATVTLAAAGVAAPHDGVAYADDRSVATPGGSRITAHADIYTWTQGNVHISVVFISPQGLDVSDIATTVLEGVSNSVDAALKE